MAVQDLQDAKDGVEEGLLEVGCNIQLKIVTKDVSQYDPYNANSGVTTTLTPKLGIIKNFATTDLATSMPKELINNYKMSITINAEHDVNTGHFIVFDNKTYKVLFVYPFIMLDEVYKYEILVG